MYLKTIFELEEEGITPLRARIAERLHQSGPTVSQTVGRMERDGLVTVQGDRHLELSPKGRKLATRVMRKHRLAERLLVDLIGLDWDIVHVEACRWEHVISEEVERRLVQILDDPTVSPYGNPIPGLDELGVDLEVEEFREGVDSLDRVLASQPAAEETKVLIRRISEPLQTTPEIMEILRRAGALPGRVVTATPAPGGVQLSGSDAAGPGAAGRRTAAAAAAAAAGASAALATVTETAEISEQHASHIFVKRI
ncbi:metal-dependent transcriptional regulator [Actinopolymorpha alba]|uniref:metal-dependent transcriptional regulator n=1 Tax=Actinopolymorpha alba TaxID=533267 RepID=UPI00058BF58A